MQEISIGESATFVQLLAAMEPPPVPSGSTNPGARNCGWLTGVTPNDLKDEGKISWRAD
jgi:hypothetical protein